MIFIYNDVVTNDSWTSRAPALICNYNQTSLEYNFRVVFISLSAPIVFLSRTSLQTVMLRDQEELAPSFISTNTREGQTDKF